MARLGSYSPCELDTHDANFPRECIAWASQAQFEIAELVIASDATIAASKELMAEVDRVLTRR